MQVDVMICNIYLKLSLGTLYKYHTMADMNLTNYKC